MHSLLHHDTPYTNALLLEKNLTRFVWYSKRHLKEALAEISNLAQHDFDAAVLKASCLYGMARAEYRSHFLTKFDPRAPKQTIADDSALHLPWCCHAIYEALQALGLVPEHHPACAEPSEQPEIAQVSYKLTT